MHTLSPTHDFSAVLLRRMVAITLLFVGAQAALFYAHYRATELIDSLVNSAIWGELWHPLILWPIAQFIVVQVLAYGLCVAAFWLMAVSISEWFHLSKQRAVWLGNSLTLSGYLLILAANDYFFPQSFFSHYLHETLLLSSSVVRGMGVLSGLYLLTAALFTVWYLFTEKRRYQIALFLAFCLAVMFVGNLNFYLKKTTQAKPSSLPNIIIIGLDSLRPDFVANARAEVQTPNINAFLQSATVFSQAYSPLGRTFPAWVSILTGKYPKHSGARANLVEQTAIVQQDTFAKHLQQAGYYTVYASDEKRFSNVSKRLGFNEIWGPHIGVDDFILGGLGDFPLTNLLVNLPTGRWLFPFNYANRAAAITYRPNSFLQLIAHGLQTPIHQPLFLAVHLCLPHWPYFYATPHASAQPHLLIDEYGAAVEAVDKQFGQLLQLLKQASLLNGSILVLLSDHGTTLGLLGDRVIDEAHYVGDPHALRFFPRTRLNRAERFSMDFQHDYTLSTSYGQGTDVLSLKQNHVILAIKGLKFQAKSHLAKTIAEPVTLLDIAPTLLAALHLPALSSIDGMSLLSSPLLRHRSLFLETADTIHEIETDDIDVNNVLKRRIAAYQVNPQTGWVYFVKPALEAMVLSKERAVLSDHWLLAYFPASMQTILVPVKVHDHLVFIEKAKQIPPYFVLVDLTSGAWSMGLHSPLAAHFPAALLHQFQQFYGDEIPIRFS